LVLVIFYGKSLSDYFPLPLQLFLHCFFFFFRNLDQINWPN